jgi:hypothetical protein
MNDDTRKLLKVFGVAVTDAESEVERLASAAAQLLSTGAGTEALARLLEDAGELSRELNTRWLEVTQRVFAIQAVSTSNWPKPGPGCNRPNDDEGASRDEGYFPADLPGSLDRRPGRLVASDRRCRLSMALAFRF